MWVWAKPPSVTGLLSRHKDESEPWNPGRKSRCVHFIAIPVLRAERQEALWVGEASLASNLAKLVTTRINERPYLKTTAKRMWLATKEDT